MSAFNDNYVEYERRRDKDGNLSPEDYLDIIRPYLREIINNHKAHREWKTQLTMKINFVSSLDTREICLMYSKRDNAKFMMGC